MRIGVPKEVKKGEHRIGMVPSSVRELVKHDHEVLVQSSAAVGIGLSDDDYRECGATILDSAEEVFDQAEMIVKVKEPQSSEYGLLKEHHLLFTYLHLAPDPDQTKALVDSGCTAIAYETVTGNNGGLPLLTPMSEVAGRISVQAGAHCLEKAQGGSGVLLGGVPGVGRAKVLILGGGVVGSNALRMAMGSEAMVIVMDKSVERLRQLDNLFGSRIKTIFATETTAEKFLKQADLVIGAVLVPGAETPKLIRQEHLKMMKPGSVIVDVSIDQGGCVETSRPTTFEDPTFIVDDIVHYCVANMPGAVPKTSAFALNNATLPYIKHLADLGFQEALREDEHLLEGLNVHRGKITYKAVANALQLEYMPPLEALEIK